mgnify:CR=1 FL=1
MSVHPDFAGTDLASLSDAEVMAALGEPGALPEGQFFPDTYTFSKGSTDVAEGGDEG